MSLADEMLNELSNNSGEPHIIIDSKRVITVPDVLKRLAVQYDHNIETVTFDCPRYWDNVDMSGMVVYINYKLPDGTLGSYIARNITIDENDDSIMHFDWTIEGNITQKKGTIVFLVCIKKTEGNVESIHWNSELNTQTYISEGLEGAESPFEGDVDNLTYILTRLDKLETKYKNFEVSDTGLAIANGQYLSGQFITKQTIPFSTNKNKVDASYTGIYVGDAGSSSRVTKLPYTLNIRKQPYGAYISIDNNEFGIANVGDCYFAIMQISLTRPEGVTSTIELSDIYPYEFEKNATTGRDSNVLGLDQFSGWDVIHHVIIPFQIKDNVSRQGIYFNAMDGFNTDAAGCSYNVTFHNISVYKATKIVVEDLSKLRYFSSDVTDMNVGLGKKTYVYQGSISTVPPENYIVSGIFDISTNLLTSLIAANTNNTSPNKTIDIYSDSYGCCKTSHETMKLKSQNYVHDQIGDIDAALDELHDYAQALISGGATE